MRGRWIERKVREEEDLKGREDRLEEEEGIGKRRGLEGERRRSEE